MKYFALVASFVAQAAFFSVAAQAAPEYNEARAAAHKNHVDIERVRLALALVKANTEGYVCETDAYTGTTIAAVAEVFNNASEKHQATFLKNLPVQSPLFTNLAYKVATRQINLDVFKKDDFVKNFAPATFAGPFAGVYGNQYMLTLQPGGVAVYENKEILNEEPWVRTNQVPATWTLQVNGQDLTLTVKSKTETRVFKGNIEEMRRQYFRSHEIQLKLNGEDTHQGLSTSPAECEA